jgi:glucose-6-phosphate 1-dehydrogenase
MAEQKYEIGMVGLGVMGRKLAYDRQRAQIVVEKPFGHDLASAVALNSILTAVFNEAQIYRNDHYLGKETVQNNLAFRFANALFEPIWDRRYIDHVQITVAEQVGVEHRGAYFEHAGALRDMIQNHLMQILCLIAMEPMVSFDADEIRNKKVDVLRAIRPIVGTRSFNLPCAANMEMEASWSVLLPILNGWEKSKPMAHPPTGGEKHPLADGCGRGALVV